MRADNPHLEVGLHRRRLAIAVAILSAGALALGQVGLWLSIEPIATWSYDLSWWSAIVLADAAVFLRTGGSILLSRPRAFAALAIASGVYWLVYETANLRLANWYYVGIPRDTLTRTLGVFVSFATVLPGVLEIHALISSFAAPSIPKQALEIGSRLRFALFAAGAASVFLPLAFPRIAYPWIWGAAFLLLEPWLAPRDPRSLLHNWLAGAHGPLLRMLAAGAVTGILWETWNWRSPAKWIYTVPLFEEGKLFEMPYLGFVGFVPFALGCHSFARALVLARVIPEWDPAAPAGSPPLPGRTILALGAAIPFSVLAIASVDRCTVHSFRPTIEDVPGMPAELARRLEAAGIRRPEDLSRAGSLCPARVDPSDLRALRPEWRDAARLMTVRGLGRRGLDWLSGAGVRTVEDLAELDAEELLGGVLAARGGAAPEPTLAEVRVWIHGARASLR